MYKQKIYAMKTLIFIVLLSTTLGFIFLPLQGQNTISGKVVDESNVPLIGANVLVKGTAIGTITDINGIFSLTVPDGGKLKISYTGYQSKVITIDHKNIRDTLVITLEPAQMLDEVVVSGNAVRHQKTSSTRRINMQHIAYSIDEDHESYYAPTENTFQNPNKEALSTFSIDVDRASYSNVRRFINQGNLPPKDAVRVEEMINYFDYQYNGPTTNIPIAVHTTLTNCPWNKQHHLLHIGLQGKKIATENLPPSNLVFLVDVSGSMNSSNKLPLVQSSFQMLLNHLRPTDRVAIVTYAGNAAVLLEPTLVAEKMKIKDAISSLTSGGSTAGAQGIKTAYELAEKHFIKKGNNRVILATDGDFNVGIRSAEDLETLIESKRKSGIFLSVLGYGMGNYKDHQMQTLADKGNGNHAYIDNLQEARKVLVKEFGGTLFTIAKDVKIQMEFNPQHVQSYRLIGYENRMLEKEDFNNDAKDAGEMGSGHVVTAIYEIVPTGVESSFVGKVDELKYQENKKPQEINNHSNELATLKFRYKNPDQKKSKKIIHTIQNDVQPMERTNNDVQFSIAVAEFGMLLKQSDYILNGSFENVIELAERSRGNDAEGYRAEFIRLVKSVMSLEGIAGN